MLYKTEMCISSSTSKSHRHRRFSTLTCTRPFAHLAFRCHLPHRPGGMDCYYFSTEEMRSLGVKTEVKPVTKDRVSLIPKLMFFLRYGFTFSRFLKYLCLCLYTPVNLPAGVIFIVHGEMLPGELKRSRRNFLEVTERMKFRHVFRHFQKVQHKSRISALTRISCMWGRVSFCVIFRGYSVAFPSTNCSSSPSHCLVHSLLLPVRQQSRLPRWPCGLLDAWVASHL